MRPPSTPTAQAHARRLRSEMTEAERALWRELRRERIPGTRFRRQVPIGPYIADFACLKTRLVVELDGSQHVEQAQYDEERSTFLKAQGFRVLRFWNALVFTERKAVVETIVWATLHAEWQQERELTP
jgi:very-short-patch-repair endonuclease